MSIKVMTSIFEHSSQQGSCKLLLLAIADHASEDGVCWPGIPLLARYASVSERHAGNLIQKLEQAGELYVARNSGRGNTNMYYVTLRRTRDEILATLTRRLGIPPDQAERHATQIIARQKGVVQFTFSDLEKVNPGAQKGEPQCKKVNPSALKGEIAVSPEPLEPSTESPSESSPAADAPEKTGPALLDQFFGPHPTAQPPNQLTNKPTNQQTNYADPVQAGGADSPAHAIVDGICRYNGLTRGADSLPGKKRTAWTRHLAEIIGQWGGATVAQARLAWQAWTVEYAWKTGVNPFYNTFDTELGPLLVGVREGTITIETLRQKVASANGGNGNANRKSSSHWTDDEIQRKTAAAARALGET